MKESTTLFTALRCTVGSNPSRNSSLEGAAIAMELVEQWRLIRGFATIAWPVQGYLIDNAYTFFSIKMKPGTALSNRGHRCLLKEDTKKARPRTGW